MPNSDQGDGVASAEPEPEPEPPPSIHVSGFDRTESGSVDLPRWVEVATRTLVDESMTVGQLDLIFVDVAEMTDLNETHMGHDGPTDVLSFPLDTEDDDFPAPPAGEFADGPVPVHLGDVVVCPEVAERQAPEHCGSLDAELSLLIVHGVLHILGHDHAEPEETKVMQERERVHLSALGLDHPVSV